MAVNARPLLAVALAFAGGIALNNRAGAALRPSPWPAAGLLACAGLAIVRARAGLARAALGAAAVALGGAHAAWRESSDPAPLLRSRAAAVDPELPIETVGTLVRDPERAGGAWRLLLELERFDRQPAHGRVRLYLPADAEPQWRAGQRLRVGARYAPPSRFANPGSIDFAAILRTQGVALSGRVKSSRLIETLGAGDGYWGARLGACLRRSLLDGLERAFEPQGPEGRRMAGLLGALLVGVRGELAPDDDQDLRRAGLYHLIAISGLHFTLIVGALWSALRWIGVRRRAACLQVALACLVYALIAGGRSSVGRAALMIGFVLLGRLLSVPLDPLNAIGAAALALLAADPRQLEDRGFQLTFAATLALLHLQRRLGRLVPARPRFLASGLSASLAASAGVQPLVAAAFQRSAPIGIALNLIAVPGFTLLTMLGFIAASGAVSPEPAQTAARLSTMLVEGLFWLTERALELPGASARVAAPSRWELAGAYIGLALFGAAGRPWVRRCAGLMAMVTLLRLSLPPSHRAGDGLLYVHMLDVGQGDCLLVITPSGDAILVDGGGLRGSTLDVGETVVAPLLVRLGVRRIELVMLSHAHPDHLEGLFAVIRDFEVGRVWQAEGPIGAGRFQDFIGLLAQRRIPLLSVTRGLVTGLGGVRLEVLHPRRGASALTKVRNDDSLVVRLQHGRVAVLLAGDLEARGEAELASVRPRPATVLKVAHHGSRSSTTEALLEVARPRLALLSVGRRNSFGFPDREVVERLRSHRARLWRTDRHGMVTVVSDGRRVWAYPFLERHACRDEDFARQ